MPIFLCGESLGCAIILSLVLDFPETAALVRGLILMGPTIQPPREGRPPEQAMPSLEGKLSLLFATFTKSFTAIEEPLAGSTLGFWDRVLEPCIIRCEWAYRFWCML